jgi:hypothetical protein
MVLFAIYCAARQSTSLERLRVFSVEELGTHSSVGARARLESGEQLVGLEHCWELVACRAACSCEWQRDVVLVDALWNGICVQVVGRGRRSLEMLVSWEGVCGGS